MPLFDICFNFTHASFRKDEKDVLQRALDAGVQHFLVTGSDLEDSKHSVQLADKYKNGMYATTGVHPHLAHSWQDSTYAALREFASNPRVLAIGEAGLDYHRNFSSHEQQTHAFRQQIELAIELQKPLFLHERDAHDDFLTIISDYKNELDNTVVHCFTGDQRALENYLDLGFYIGITGWICDERRGAHLHDLVSLIPEDRLLIETDAPYLFPRTVRPRPKKQRNEPHYLPHIAEQIALHRGDSTERLCEYTMINSLRFLNLSSQ
jgi:TatD DNase family protein